MTVKQAKAITIVAALYALVWTVVMGSVVLALTINPETIL